MKLPQLQYDRPTPRLVSPEAAGLQGEVRGIEAGVQAIRGVGQQVTRQLEQQADTTARLEAANTRAKIERERTMMRQEVYEQYASGADDPDSLFAGLEEQDEAIIAKYADGLGSRATQYLAPQVASIRTGYRTGRDASFYEQLVTQRATTAVAEQQAEVTASLREDPYDVAPIERYLESVATLQTTDPEFQRAAEVGGLQAMLTTQILALGEGLDGEGIQAVMESDYFRQAQFDPKQVNGFSTLAKEAALAGIENDLQQLQNEMVTGKAGIDAALKEAGTMARSVPGLNREEQRLQAEELQADLARRYFHTLNREGRGQEVVQALTQDTRFDTILNPDDTERLLDAAQRSINTSKDISLTRLEATVRDGVASIVEGNPADPRVEQALQEAGALTQYMSDSERDRLERYSAEWEATKFVGQFTQNLGQQSEAQLRVAENSLEAWISDEDPDSFMYRATKRAADAGLASIREARQARLEDPAAAAMDANPDAGEAYRSVIEGLRPLMTGQMRPEDVPELRERMAAYAAEVRSTQRQGFELMQDQMRLLPKNDQVTKMLTEGLGRAEPVAQLQALSTLSTMAPPDVGNAIANQLSDKDPRLATALSFIYDGKITLAEQQLLGASARAIADDTNDMVNTNIVSDTLQRQDVSLALNGLLAKDQRMLRGAIMDVYFGYAQNQRDTSALESVDEALLETAARDVIGPTIQTNNLDANWRTLSYTVTEGGTPRFVSEREFNHQLRAAKQDPETALAYLNDHKPRSEWSIPGEDFDLESVLHQGRLRAVADGVYEVYVPNSAVAPGVGIMQQGRVMDQNGQPFRIDMRKLREFVGARPPPRDVDLPPSLQGLRNAPY